MAERVTNSSAQNQPAALTTVQVATPIMDNQGVQIGQMISYHQFGEAPSKESADKAQVFLELVGPDGAYAKPARGFVTKMEVIGQHFNAENIFITLTNPLEPALSSMRMDHTAAVQMILPNIPQGYSDFLPGSAYYVTLEIPEDETPPSEEQEETEKSEEVQDDSSEKSEEGTDPTKPEEVETDPSVLTHPTDAENVVEAPVPVEPTATTTTAE